MHDRPTDDTTRQAKAILAGSPHLAPIDRLLQDTAGRAAWVLKQRALFDRMVVAELHYEAAQPCRVKR